MRTFLTVAVIAVIAGCADVSSAKLVKVNECPFDQRWIIAVMDVENASNEPANDPLVDGLADVLITELMQYNRFRFMEREKLAQILRSNNLRSLMVVHMEVPCCSGLTRVAREAIALSGRPMSFQDVTVSLRGSMIRSETIKVGPMAEARTIDYA